MNGRQVDHYEVLGIPRAADAAEIRAAYLKLVKRYHPDVGGDESSDEMMVALNEAHDVLRDPAARAEYDQTLWADPVRPSSPEGDVLFVDVVLEKIDTGRARRKLATLNREFVRMEQLGWHVEFRHDHLVCTRDEFAPANYLFFVGFIAAAIVVILMLGRLLGASEQATVGAIVLGFAASVVFMRDIEKRRGAKPQRVTISIDTDGHPLQTAQPV